ncbi:thermonuclease family protein [Afifella sp. IM 167]|uniref:thermonuclease family protein n=1 Tax=Afifella sp. IM 167 TaxID=2033586 RepID=UPI001CCBD3BF|nr:thermonuclease family protein [Afifella sp. IM 167]MBZ8134937.1 nuclease [Afifella sp. IM 167]
MFLIRAIRAAPLCLLAGLLSGGANAAELPGPYRAEVERVVDGDTLAVRARIWLGQDVEVLVRLRGIDAPELRARCAAEREMAEAARAALARLVGEAGVTISMIEEDKYGGRVVADVARADGENLSALLRASGHARAYAGGPRKPWCGESASLRK